MGIYSRPVLKGREPKYASLKEDMSQGSVARKPAADNLQAELGQSGGKKGSGAGVPKLGRDMGNR